MSVPKILHRANYRSASSGVKSVRARESMLGIENSSSLESYKPVFEPQPCLLLYILKVSGELVSVAHALSLPAESYGNDPDIEMAWAMRAMQHAEVYYRLISSVDPQLLKLTKVDDQIYSEFRENFEKLRIDVLDPEELKSESAKEKWRPFCLKFDGIVEDFNYGTLLRLNCSQGYTEENTIFDKRIKKLCVCVHNGILLSHKKNEIMPFAALWKDLEFIILTEVSQRKTDIIYHLYVES
uniref:Protein PBDC1 isoform X2 n=1 Tax=Camelus bactrianus TaxID=9837 RepID=A0A9W3HEW0_CAMBA|nr:protein PBDC1 isoform X2 [Camelus bactrianus]